MTSSLRDPHVSVAGLAAVLLLGTGCGRPSAPVTTAIAVPCQVSGVGSADAPWREVRAAGFTFCVPGSWRSRGPASDTLDAKRWLGDGGSVSWDTHRPATVDGQGTMTVSTRIVSAGSGTTGSTPAPIPASLHTCAPSTQTPHLVGGMVLIVTQVNCDGTWTTTAWSTAPEFFVEAHAYSQRLADVDLAVMETIQPAGPAH